MRRFVRIGGGLALAILFAALLIRNVDLGQVVLAATRLSVYVLAASAALVIAGYAVRARRWQLMLRGAGVNATYRQAAPIFFASFALNNVLPLRAGDLYRCVSTLQLPAGTMAKSLGTLLTERLLDLGALIMLLSALLLFLPQARLELISIPIAALLIVALVLIAALIIFRWRHGSWWKPVFCSASPGFRLSRKSQHGCAPSRQLFKVRYPIKCASRSSSSRLPLGCLSWASSLSSALH